MKLIAKMTIVGVFFLCTIWTGVKLAKWADAESKATEGRYQNAISVLKGN